MLLLRSDQRGRVDKLGSTLRSVLHVRIHAIGGIRVVSCHLRKSPSEESHVKRLLRVLPITLRLLLLGQVV
jgi:hypothetical protein